MLEKLRKKMPTCKKWAFASVYIKGLFFYKLTGYGSFTRSNSNKVRARS